MRAFLAFEIAPEVKTYLRSVIKTMAPLVDGVKWVKEDGLHITLKFFGEIEDEMAVRLKENLAHIEKRYAPFMLALKGIGAFPDRRRTRVIIVTLKNGVDIALNIFQDIENSIEKFGISREKRSFTPHITLGRRKVPAPLLERAITPLEEKQFSVDSLVLFKSTLTREGAIYDPVWKINFGGNRYER